MAKTEETTRIWCEYCRVFVFNNRISRDKHDQSPQHKENIKKKVNALRREEQEKAKLLPKVVKSSVEGSFYNSSASSTAAVSKPNQPLLNPKSVRSKAQVLGLSG